MDLLTYLEWKVKYGGDMIKNKAVELEGDMPDSAESFNMPGGSLGVIDPPIVHLPGGTVSRISKAGCEAIQEIAIETADKFSTGLQQKRDNYPAFVGLIKNQFDHGGSKYATGAEGKEFTDLICEAFPGDSGVDWVLGTCMKYIGRYKNFRREKDLLKVATYMYLLWLKGGFHTVSDHDEDTQIGG